MKATQLYQQLEKDFITPKMSDEWFKYMGSIADFICENFKKRSIGLVCDFTTEVKKVYTAVFPSKKVMQNILKRNEANILLFVHHPSIWNLKETLKATQNRTRANVFKQIDKRLLQQFKERDISIYNLHVPLDGHGKYSTSVSLAKALGIKPQKPFAPYFGVLCGVFGKIELKTVYELKEKFESVIGHKTILYMYGGNKIKNGTVALIAGGGNDIEMLKEIAKEKVNVLITGVTIKNNYSKKAHDFAKQNNINLLGGTHYSTEKFACIAICEYFKKLGLPSEFIEDKPMMEDL